MIATPTEIGNFIEIYQTKQISRAAIRLGVTQPSLTQSLQKLEEKMATPFFFRNRQGLVPTAEGTLFYAKAQKLLDAWKELEGSVSLSRNELEGKFRIGCHQSVGIYMLPDLFKKLNEFAPKLEIELVHDFSRKITEKVISYEIEFGIVVNPVRHPDLILKKIGEDEVGFYKKKGLTDIPKKIFADSGLKQVESLLGKSIDEVFEGFTLVHTPSLEVVKTLVASGQGIGILPGRVANSENNDLTIYQKGLPTVHDEIYLAYRKEVLSGRAGKELVRLASQLS